MCGMRDSHEKGAGMRITTPRFRPCLELTRMYSNVFAFDHLCIVIFLKSILSIDRFFVAQISPKVF